MTCEDTGRGGGAWQWAQEQFGEARLGDARWVRRAVQLAASALRHPDGRITRVCETDAQRQGAYALLEAESFGAEPLLLSHSRAVCAQASQYPFVYVALDDSSLSLPDSTGSKGTGTIGSRLCKGRGFKVLSALAVSPDGVTLGLLAQSWWAREKPVAVHRNQRCLAEKETLQWERVAKQVQSQLALHAPSTQPWLLKDAGADCAELMLEDLRSERLMTVRAVYDRRVCDPMQRSRAAVGAAAIAGYYEMWVPAHGERSARVAKFEVRYKALDLLLHQKQGGRHWSASIWCVRAREIECRAKGERPIEWTLYSNYPVASFGDAMLVLRGYAFRWRIEEWHKAWKSGACDVERTQLRSATAIQKWATMLGVVATRILQLRDSSRTHPEDPASNWLDAWELKALAALRPKPAKGRTKAAPLTIQQAVHWIAELGGYTGKFSGGPPGVITIERGWDRVAVVALALKNIAESEM